MPRTGSRAPSERIWAPWRRKFVRHGSPRGCIFCTKPRSREDAANLVLERGERAFSMLNLYPYNAGHVLIAPYRHVPSVVDFTEEEHLEIFRIASATMKRIDRLLKPHGYNLGFNLGRVSGAGYDKHAHLHVVPRWNGDTNFMPVVAGTKVISESLQELRAQLLRR